MKRTILSIIWGGATILNIYNGNKWLAIISFIGFTLCLLSTTTKRAG